jgi:fructose-1-phosphate kinase PfkB-like protein
MLIVNPNFTIDRTIRLDLMVPGAVHRTGTATTSLGGKGVNVARVARAFGAPGVLIGFLPAFSAAELATLAAAEGAELDGVPIGGTVRAASVLLERSGRVTVFNEPGPTVEDVDWTRLLREVERRAPAHQTVVCSGSLPPGSPVDAYARVIAVARRAGLRSVVDATGEVLLSALAEHPDVVSPNLPEAEALVSGATIEDVEPTGGLVGQRAADAVRGLTDRGAGRRAAPRSARLPRSTSSTRSAPVIRWSGGSSMPWRTACPGTTPCRSRWQWPRRRANSLSPAPLTSAAHATWPPG